MLSASPKKLSMRLSVRTIVAMLDDLVICPVCDLKGESNDMPTTCSFAKNVHFESRMIKHMVRILVMRAWLATVPRTSLIFASSIADSGTNLQYDFIARIPSKSSLS